MGLLVLTPVLALGVVGIALHVAAAPRRGARRRGGPRRRTCSTTRACATSRRSAVSGPALPPTLIPFAALPLALAIRRLPLTTLGLGLVSAFQMVVVTATGPLAAYDGDWLTRARAKEFAQTAASLVNFTGWYTIPPFLLASAVAAVAAFLGSRGVKVRLAELPLAGVALGLWALAALAADNPNGKPPGEGYVLALALAAMGTVVAVALVARSASQSVSATPTRTARRSRSPTSPRSAEARTGTRTRSPR